MRRAVRDWRNAITASCHILYWVIVERSTTIAIRRAEWLSERGV